MKKYASIAVCALLCLSLAACASLSPAATPAIAHTTAPTEASATPEPATPDPATPTPSPIPTPTPEPKPAIKQILVGYKTCFILRVDGTLWAWGNNEYGQLGDGTKTNRTRFVKILDNVKKLTPNGMAIREDNTLWTWGGEHLSPTKLMAGVQDANLNYIVKTDGALLAYGSRFFALGDGVPADTSSKKTVPLNRAKRILTGVRGVPAGGFRGTAIKVDGTLWVWGDCKLMNSTDKAYWKAVKGGVDPAVPVKIMGGIKDAANLSAYYSDGMLVLKRDGTVLQWGIYITSPRTALPMIDPKSGNPVPGFPDIQQPFPDRATAIAAYSDFFAILQDGRLVTWGYDNPNDWMNAAETSPQDRDGPAGWEGPNQLNEYHEIARDAAAVSAGCDTLLVLKNDGSLWAAGKACYDADNPDAVSESKALAPAFQEMWGTP